MTIETPTAAYVRYDGNGSATQFTFPFTKFEDDDVVVYLFNSSTGNFDLNSSYAISGSTITFNTAPPTGTGNVLIFRRTDFNASKVPNFNPGSSIRGEDLDKNFLQSLRVDQEFRDLKVDKFAPEVWADLNLKSNKITEVADGVLDTDAVNRKQLGNVIASDITGDTTQGVVLTKTQSGSNSGDEMVISISDSSPSQKGSVIIAQASGEAVNVAYSSGTATIGVDRSTASQQGVVTVTQAASEAVNVTYTADGEVEVGVDKSTASQQGVVKVTQAASEAVNVIYAADGEVTVGVDRSTASQQGVVKIQQSDAANVTYTADGEVTIGVDKSTATQQGVVKIQSTTPVTTTYTANGEVTLSIADGSVDFAKIKPDDVRTLAEQNASPSDAGSDDELGTTAANNKRYDTIYQAGTPSGTDFAVGKMWYDHANDQTLSVWSGTNWLGISSGGTFITQPTVIWVDQANGLDSNDGHRIIDSMKTIKAAVASADNGDIVLVAPGIYRETAPIDITVNNLSIVGQSLRSCFVHPTPATELNSLFRVNSGTQIQNFSFGGLKASGTRGGHAIDSDSTYGLPTNQAFVCEFYPNAVIYKSPYIQNCTNFADSGIYNHTQAEYSADNALGGFFDPNNVNQGGFGGDLTSGPTGGGLLVDGSAVSSSSPLRSMVVDSFTQITLDGPGILCCNNGYAQLVSFFGTFCHYHAKSLNGGQLNLSNCTTDYGRYGLIADGKSLAANFTAPVSANAAAGDITFTIGAQTAGTDWYGSDTRPQDNMSVVIGANTYPVKSAVANGSGWDVTIENPDPTALATNLGLIAGLTAGDVASFFNRSYISTGGHTFEYVGAGTDYRAAPENGGVPVEANQVKNLNNGKVFQSSTDHNGKFKVGDTFAVNQRSGEVFISLDAYRPEVVNDLTPELGGNLDVLARSIVSSSNRDINITPHGTGDVVMSTAAVSDLTSGRVVLAGTNGELQDNGNLTFDGSTLSVTGLTATGSISLAGLTYPSSDGLSDHVLKTDGSGALSFVSIASISNAGIQNVGDDSSPQLGGDLDVTTHDIVSTSNRDIDLDPNGSGSVVIKGNSTRGAGELTLNCEFNSHGVKIQGPPHSAGATYTITLPNNTGTNGQALVTNGSGVTSWSTIDTSTVTGNLTIADKIIHNGDTNTAIRFPANDTFSVETGGSERMRIDSSGNLGIGTSSPSARLEARQNGTGNLIQVWSSDLGTNDRSINLKSPSSDSTSEPFVFQTGNSVAFQIDATEAMRIDDSGNVGIGTSSPNNLLHVSGNSNPQIKVSATNTGTNSAGFYIENQGQRNWQVWADRSTDQFRIGNNSRANANLVIKGSTGNVGIGTSSPQTKLHVTQSSDNSSDGIRLTRSNSNASYSQYIDASSRFNIGYSNPATADPASSYLSISSEGNVGIGTSSPQEKLHVNGTLLSTPVNYSPNQDQPYLIAGTSGYTGATTNWNTFGFQHRIKSDSNGVPRITVDNVNGEVFCVDAGGNVGIGTSSPGGTLHLKDSTPRVVFQPTGDTQDGRIEFLNAAGTFKGSIRYKFPNNSLEFHVNGSQKAIIDSSGNVGIGTSSPSTKLDVNGTISGTLQNTDVLNATASSSAGAVGTYAFLVDTDGSPRSPGYTTAGSNLEWANANGDSQGTNPSGSWRLMGELDGGSNSAKQTSLWLRYV